nr:hypothetical protein [Paratractidigestivibacter sp.]
MRQLTAAAPAASYSRAMAMGSNSGLIRPLEGDAFLTSQINDMPSARSAASNGKANSPVGDAASSAVATARARQAISARGTSRFSASTRSRVRAAIFSRILPALGSSAGITRCSL